MNYEDLSKFTWEELSNFTWEDLTKDKLDLLKSIKDSDREIPKEVSDKLYNMCYEVLKSYNADTSILENNKSVKDWSDTLSKIMLILSGCGSVFEIINYFVNWFNS